jgi:subtilisin
MDINSHGTHISGSICASSKEYIIGIAPKSKVIPIKVLDDYGIGEMKNITKGIRYGIERKVDIMCLAIGCNKPYGPLRKAIKEACKQGIPLFCAGGNIRKEIESLYPARYPETIAIAALGRDFKRADFSNTGKQNIDFLAPGVDILSTTTRGGYSILSGSSTAVPFAVGAASLLLSAKRKYKLNIRLETVEDYRRSFREHGVDISKYKGTQVFAGHGIIQPEKLVEWLQTSGH